MLGYTVKQCFKCVLLLNSITHLCPGWFQVNKDHICPFMSADLYARTKPSVAPWCFLFKSYSLFLLFWYHLCASQTADFHLLIYWNYDGKWPQLLLVGPENKKLSLQNNWISNKQKNTITTSTMAFVHVAARLLVLTETTEMNEYIFILYEASLIILGCRRQESSTPSLPSSL